MKILGTGLDGLAGSRIVELLKDKYEFEASNVDITDKEKITEKIITSKAPIVLHLAARTSVDGCEEDKEEDIRVFSSYCHAEFISASRFFKNKILKQVQDDSLQVKHDKQKRFWTSQNDEESGQEIASPVSWQARNDKNKKKTAWAVNVYGTQNVAEACEKSNKKLIYISTDFAFDGSLKVYSEEDKPSPINWYGKTKYEGEKIVQKLSSHWVIARIAYPYRAHFTRGDFVRTLVEKLEKKEKLQMVTDHIITPTFIDDIAFALDALIQNSSTGIFHVVGSEFISPYDAARKIAKIFGFDQVRLGFDHNNITKTTRSEYFRNRAPRPFHLALKNDKIRGLGVRMRGFEEGLEEVKRQILSLSS